MSAIDTIGPIIVLILLAIGIITSEPEEEHLDGFS